MQRDSRQSGRRQANRNDGKGDSRQYIKEYTGAQDRFNAIFHTLKFLLLAYTFPPLNKKKERFYEWCEGVQED